MAFCELTQFRSQAGKFGMVSLDSSNPKPFNWRNHGLEIYTQLPKIWPRVASKIFANEGPEDVPDGGLQLLDIYVEEWAASAIASFYATNGYAGMTLAEFLEKVSHERTAPQREE